MQAHLRTEAYPVYQSHQYPSTLTDDQSETISYERNIRLIEEAKRGL
jgi:hypothetical protein